MSERRAKEDRRQAELLEHRHCHECGAAIAAGKETPMGARVPIVAPDGRVGHITRPVPICPTCLQAIEAAQAKASHLIAPKTAKPHLVLPEPGTPA